MRSMPSIGRHRYEPRVRDTGQNWRIVSRVDEDAIVIVEVFAKENSNTPKKAIETCKARLRAYDGLIRGE